MGGGRVTLVIGDSITRKEEEDMMGGSSVVGHHRPTCIIGVTGQK
jgi:hypothetical protein